MTKSYAKSSAKWRQNNPDKVIEYRINYYIENKEKESIRQQKSIFGKKRVRD